jgi:hypothetical protein
MPEFDGQPVFELKKEQENYGRGIKTMQRIGLTTVAEDWLAKQTPDAMFLFCPIYPPMIVPPRQSTSLSEGGYLATPMRLLKRQTGKKAQQLVENADLSAVFSAVDALQNTAYRINIGLPSTSPTATGRRTKCRSTGVWPGCTKTNTKSIAFADNLLPAHRFWGEARQTVDVLGHLRIGNATESKVPAFALICRSVWMARATAISISARWAAIPSAEAQRN